MSDDAFHKLCKPGYSAIAKPNTPPEECHPNSPAFIPKSEWQTTAATTCTGATPAGWFVGFVQQNWSSQ